MTEEGVAEIILPNDVQAISRLRVFVKRQCQRVAFDDKTTGHVCLAIEEAVVNVMNYAYPEGAVGTVDVEANTDDGCLIFTIIDRGKPFDPTVYKKVDVNLPVEERPIGGLGIHLIRQLTDTVSYNRSDGKNILTLSKKQNH